MPITSSEGNLLTSWPIEHTPAWLVLFGKKPYRQLIAEEPGRTARWTYLNDADLKIICKKPPQG